MLSAVRVQTPVASPDTFGHDSFDLTEDMLSEVNVQVRTRLVEVSLILVEAHLVAEFMLPVII